MRQAWRTALANGAVLPLLALGMGLAGCAAPGAFSPKIQSRAFGRMPDGTAVEEFTLRNGRGMEARILNYGGIVVSLQVPDRHG